MPDFFNPYHFVPVKPGERPDDITVQEFEGRASGNMTHARYVSRIEQGGSGQEVYSGRIICRLMTEDPIFIGDKREELADHSHRVTPFELEGKPAIPASTLLGLISSIAEAASNSALRVLEKRHYSYRVGMREGLGALGMLVREIVDEKPVLRLRPLALPSLTWRETYAELPNKYRGAFTRPLLKVYVNGYRIRPGSYPPIVEKNPGSFLARKEPDSYSADNQEFWYVKLAGACSLSGNRITCTQPHLKSPPTRGGRVVKFLNGQRAEGTPLTQSEFDGLPSHQQGQYTRGILRVLGVEGREGRIPTGKRHEMFLPYTPEMETDPTLDATDALKQFHALAAERTRADDDLPFHSKGSRRSTRPTRKNCNIELRAGDIVFFEVDPSDPSRVSEISISSIWRRSAGGSSHDYFRQISPEILPFSSERTKITLAEKVFGFVEQRHKGEERENAGLAFAGRIRFSFGLLSPSSHGSYYLPEVLIKVLDSPKPPCPSLYFKNNDGTGTYIAKKKLNPQQHHPQGRKFYLHRHSGSPEPWRTQHKNDNLTQKSRFCPLRTGLYFLFHIDFINLSRRELSLICYALRPFREFRHKLGMGKSIGLGKVLIEPEGLFLIDRIKRYQEENLSCSSRYHKAWVKPGVHESWPKERYASERASVFLGGVDDSETLAGEFADAMDSDIKRALELLGDPSKITNPVHTPQFAGQDIERETFKWFVDNDSKAQDRQYLKPLTAGNTQLPPLEQ